MNGAMTRVLPRTRLLMRVLVSALFSALSIPAGSAGMPTGGKNGIVEVPSHYSVEETVDRLKRLLEERGIELFCMIDHSGEAAKVGMKMRPTKLLIFGNPRAGTPLMLAAPSIAIDLPLKILVWEDADGKVWLSYNSPRYLAERHSLPAALLPGIEVVGQLAAKAGE